MNTATADIMDSASLHSRDANSAEVHETDNAINTVHGGGAEICVDQFLSFFWWFW